MAADGSWGPIDVDGEARYDVDGEARYEFVVARAGDGAHHFYREPALRSNHFVHLVTSEPGRGIDSLMERGPDHAALVITRDKEFWGAATRRTRWRSTARRSSTRRRRRGGRGAAR